MEAPIEVQNQWKLEKEHGDIERIHEITGISRITITSALRTGMMSDSTFEAIKNFYKEKRKEKRKLIKEALG